MISADHAVVRPGGSASLTVTGCADCAYLWSTGATDSTIVVTPVSTTSYTVSITTSAGCACNALEQTVVVNDCAFNPEDFFVPTAFTPDGDQINDEFCVRSELEIAPDEMVDFLLIIYNRWGQELFRGNSFGDCWDGTFRGTPVAPDVYGYYLQLMCRDEQYSRKGDVMILR
jgi:gliding motility-associated-like protein